MPIDRSHRRGPRALALALAVSLPLSGWAQASSPSKRTKAAPAQKKSPSASPSSGSGEQKGNEFQTYLNAATRLYANLEYEQALEKLARAKSYVRDVNDDVTLSLYEGIIQADMGQQEQSQVSFRAGLLLKPDAQLPVKVSPKVERDFEALRVEVRRELDALQARQQAQQPTVERAEPPAPPPEDTRPAPPPLVTTEAPAPRSKVLPYSLLGGGAVLVGGGVVLGLSALSYNTDKKKLTANEAIEARGSASTQLTIGTVLVGGGLAAIGSGVALLLMPRDTPAQSNPAPGASLQFSPLPGGFALGTTGHF